jgi:hypothetical protein
MPCCDVHVNAACSWEAKLISSLAIPYNRQPCASSLMLCPINKFTFCRTLRRLILRHPGLSFLARVAGAREESRIGLDDGSSTAGQSLQPCWLSCAAQHGAHGAELIDRLEHRNSARERAGFLGRQTRANDKWAAPHVEVFAGHNTRLAGCGKPSFLSTGPLCYLPL